MIQSSNKYPFCVPNKFPFCVPQEGSVYVEGVMYRVTQRHKNP